MTLLDMQVTAANGVETMLLHMAERLENELNQFPKIVMHELLRMDYLSKTQAQMIIMRAYHQVRNA